MKFCEEACSGTAVIMLWCAMHTTLQILFSITPAWSVVVLLLGWAGFLLLCAFAFYELGKWLDRRRWRKFWEREAKEQEARHG